MIDSLVSINQRTPGALKPLEKYEPQGKAVWLLSPGDAYPEDCCSPQEAQTFTRAHAHDWHVLEYFRLDLALDPHTEVIALDFLKTAFGLP